MMISSGRDGACRPWHQRWLPAIMICVVLLAVAGTVLVILRRHQQPPRVPLGLRTVATVALPGDTSRFDYASLDVQRGLLFIAHLGVSQVIEVDVRAGRVVRTIPDLPGVHGVLVVPPLHRVFATATDANQMVILDEDTGTVLGRGPTGGYPDGPAYDPRHNTVWTTNESGGSEIILDAATAAVRGTVRLGGDAWARPCSRLMSARCCCRHALAVTNVSSRTARCSGSSRLELATCSTLPARWARRRSTVPSPPGR